MNAFDSIRAAMHRAGLDYSGPIEADGKLRRFRAGDDKSKNSWYVLFAGPPMAGAFGCWKRGIKETSCEREPREMSQAQWSEVRRRWQEADRERERTEAERQAKARKTAAWILNRANPVTAHGYLARKGVKAHGESREYRGAIALPLRDINGDLHSFQFISAVGEKRFLSGGRVQGCFYTLADKADGPLMLCEGYATGASIREAAATGFPMPTGNVPPPWPNNFSGASWSI